MKLLVLASLSLGACNQIYGLDQTKLFDAFEQFPDADQDAIADARDNCPTVANFDQRDGDDDKIGDACDTCEACEPCSKEPLHDEDADHVSDLCDPCPAGDLDTDSDGDGIGDGCEHANVPQQRTIFDGFHQTSADWLETGARWEIANDVVTAKSGGAVGNFEYIRVDTLPTSTNWYIETSVTLADVSTKYGGIYLSGSGLGTRPGCVLAGLDGNMYRLLSGATTIPVTLGTGPVRLRYAAENPVGATQRFRCSMVGTAHEVVQTVGAISYPLTISLAANRPGTAFSYFDFVTP